jgi:hypothetical protein
VVWLSMPQGVVPHHGVVTVGSLMCTSTTAAGVMIGYAFTCDVVSTMAFETV